MNTLAKTKVTFGRPLAWKDLPPKSVMLSMQTGSGVATPAPSRARSAGRTRQVIVDGVLMEMQEEFLLGQIRAGTFIVVYPGTNIPWDPNEDRHPEYPPDWFPGL